MIEPYHASIYFSPDTKEIYSAAGLKGGWMGYFASRSAALGPVPAEVVIATFYNFHPAMVRRAIPDAWSFSTPERVLEARLQVADAGLRRALGDLVDSSSVREADALAWKAVATAEPTGRPLFAAHVALPHPEQPHLSLWHAATCLREHRGDGHVACLLVEGIDGCEAHVLMVASGTIPAEVQRSFRGWSEQEWGAAEDRLRARGLLDEDGALTEQGKAVRGRVEGRTDALALQPLRVLGRAGVDDLCTHMAVLTRKIYEAETLTFPNPMGLTRAEFG